MVDRPTITQRGLRHQKPTSKASEWVWALGISRVKLILGKVRASPFVTIEAEVRLDHAGLEVSSDGTGFLFRKSTQIGGNEIKRKR